MSADDSVLRPTFIIGGAPRSGTTLLCEVLDRHPDVRVARPFVPEPKVFVTPTTEGRAEYLRRYAALFADPGPETARGEKTSYYLENEEVPARILETLGSVRLLFIVREPVQRAYSNYLWSRQNGLETLPFVQAVEEEGHRGNPLGPDRAYARPFDYLTRGRYATFAERYHAAFGRDAVRFVLYEDLERRPAALLREIQAFIGVSPLLDEVASAGRVNATPDGGRSLDPAVAADLRARMAPEVERFGRITGLDLTPWGYHEG